MKASIYQGHCQACGRVQVVLDGKNVMSKHGYSVRHGYFQGICIGNDHAPLEQDRSYLDWVVDYLRKEAVRHVMAAERLQSGADLPKAAQKRSICGAEYYSRRPEAVKLRGQPIIIPWHEANEQEQRYQLQHDIAMHEREARLARAHADGLVELADRVHGQPLIDREAVEQAERKARAEKKAPVEGAYRTKQAQKDDLERLNREFSKQTRVMIDAGVDYMDLPFDLHHFNPNRAAKVLAKYPQHRDAILSLNGLYVAREVIKSRPVIK